MKYSFFSSAENRLIHFDMAAYNAAIKKATAETAAAFPTTPGIIQTPRTVPVTNPTPVTVTNPYPVGSSDYLKFYSPDSSSTYGTPIDTTGSRNVTYPAFTDTTEIDPTTGKTIVTITALQNAQKAQAEYYKLHGSTDPSIAADIVNLGGGSGDFNQVNPYQQQTDLPPATGNNPQNANIITPGTAGYTPAAWGSSSVKTLQQQRDEEIARIPTTIQRLTGYDKNGNPIYQTISDPDYQNKVNKMKERFVQEDATAAMTRKSEQAGVASRSAGDALGQVKTGDINAVTSPGTMQSRSAERGQLRLDRQKFIDTQRKTVNPKTGKVYSDAEIKQMINTLPPEQTGGVLPIKPSTPSPVGAGTTTGQKTTTTPQAGKETPITQQDKAGTDMQQEPVTGGQLAKAEKAKLSEVLAPIIAQDPMGTLVQYMMFDEIDQKYQALEAAGQTQNANIVAATQADMNTQTFLDRYTAIHQAENDKLTGILTQGKDSTQKYIKEQQARDIERLNWEKDVETQKMAKQKTQQLLSQSIMNALGGGAFSGAANEQLASTEREWDTAIANLGKEYDFKKSDVSALYTQKYIDTQNQFNLDIFNASKQLNDTIEGYSVQGFNSKQAMNSAITKAKNDYRTTSAEIMKNYTTNIQGMVKEMETIKNNEENRKIAHQNHLDSMDNARATRAATAAYQGYTQGRNTIQDANAAINTVKTRYLNKGSSMQIYEETKQYTDNFNSAYSQFINENATVGDRASASSQAIFQFSHGQNPGSLRIQDTPAENTIANQNIIDKFKGEWSKTFTGGAPMTQEAMDGLKTLVDSAASIQFKKASVTAISDWAQLSRSYPTITPSQVFDNPDILKVIYDEEKKAYLNTSNTNSSGATLGGKPPMSLPEISNTFANAGFAGDALKTITAIAMAESRGGYPEATGDVNIQDSTWGPSIGLAQIRSLKDPSGNPWRDPNKLTDPSFNAQAAWEISKHGTDFSPWSSYKNGGYKRYLSSIIQ